MKPAPEHDRRTKEVCDAVRRDLAAEIDARVRREAVRRLDAAGDLERATALMKAVVEAGASAVDRLDYAKLLMKAGRWRDGGRELEEGSDVDAVALAGRHWSRNNLYYVAYAFFNLGRYKEAAESFRGAQSLIDTWGDPRILKRFHFHQGLAFHLERQFLEAAECYRRAMVAPGPGDSHADDLMDEDDVEAAQALNDDIEPFMELAQRGKTIDVSQLEVVPAYD